jgi:prepilin-type N-terminal cleavage/methylation domain-containing protein
MNSKTDVRAIRCSRTRQQSAGFSLIELLIVIVILGILSSISTLYLISSRRAANGASAVATMRSISSAQASYSAGVGNKDYGEPDNLFHEEFIDSAVAAACSPLPTRVSVSGLNPPPGGRPKSGFLFDFTTSLATPSSPPSYVINGRPLNAMGVSRDGDRTIYVDQTGVIRVSSDPAVLADVNSPSLQ